MQKTFALHSAHYADDGKTGATHADMTAAAQHTGTFADRRQSAPACD
jgi:hypothetical protein